MENEQKRRIKLKVRMPKSSEYITYKEAVSKAGKPYKQLKFGVYINCIAWYDDADKMKWLTNEAGSYVEIEGILEENEWNGNVTHRIKLLDAGLENLLPGGAHAPNHQVAPPRQPRQPELPLEPDEGDGDNEMDDNFL